MLNNIETHEDQAFAKTQWQALCAKAGMTEAGSVKASGLSVDEAHDARKTVRRAINKFVAEMTDKEMADPAIGAALNHASKLVAQLSSGIDMLESKGAAKSATNSDLHVMRNEADFAKRYRTNEQFKAHDDDGMNVADFLRGVANLRTSPQVHNALSVGTDSSGGYSVPSRLMPGILSAMVPVSSLMRAGAGIVTMEDGGKTFTTAAVNAIPTAAWRAEAGALATSDPTFRAITATPRSLAFTFKISRELLADGVGITEALNNAIGQAFAKELDRTGLRGTGTAPVPRGILNTSGIQSVTNGTNGTALSDFGNLFSAAEAILGADCPFPTAAIMAPRSLIRLGSVEDATGQVLTMPPMLRDMQLIATSQVPINLTVGSSTDCSEIYVGDFSKMFFAMRESVSVQLLSELYAATGEIGFACHMRADVVLSYPAAFAVVTGVR